MAYNYFGNVREVNILAEHRRRVVMQVDIRYRLKDTLDPFDISVPLFRSFYRISQADVFELTELIRPYAGGRACQTRISLCVRLLCALAFYAQGSYQRGVGAIAYLSVSQATMSKMIHEITEALNHPNILRTFIHFPATPAEWEHEIRANAHLPLPRVLGTIDGTLIKVVPPKKDENRRPYMSRKGYFALNVQLVCSSDLYIFDVNARFPGSANDPFIYSASSVKDIMRQAFQESRCWLLGDSIYPLEPWLHTPIVNAEPGTLEYEYTEAHTTSKNPIERCNGILKGRWRCLLWDRTLHYTPQTAGFIVNACVVLHNFCRLRKVPDPPPIMERFNQHENYVVPEENEVDNPEEEGVRHLRERALEGRQSLIDYVARRRVADA